MPITREEKNERRRNKAASDPAYRAKNYERLKKWKQNNPEKWLVYKRRRYDRSPFLRLIAKAKIRAKAGDIQYNLTIDWARARWTGRCEITGAEFQKTTVGRMTSFSASLDRIDPSKGYTQDNCRFILCAINRLKGDESDEIMFQIARLLTGH